MSRFYTLAVQKKTGVPVTFTPVDATVINNVWKVEGNTESTDLIFVKTFTAPGTYTVSHECTATCGTPCTPYSEQVEILAEPVTPESLASGAQTDYTWLFIIAGAVVVVGGIVLLSGEDKEKKKRGR